MIIFGIVIIGSDTTELELHLGLREPDSQLCTPENKQLYADCINSLFMC